MALTKLSEENYAWVRAHPKLAIAAANLRGQAGMAEVDIYKTMAREVAPDARPSYRDLRAAFYTYHANHSTFEGHHHHRIDPETGKVVALKTTGEPRYRVRLAAQYGPADRDRLKRKTVVGYMIQAKGSTNPEEWADPEAFVEWERSQDYDETPPF